MNFYNLFNSKVLEIIRWLDTIPFFEMIGIVIGIVFLVIGVLLILIKIFCKSEEEFGGAAMASEVSAGIYGLIIALILVSLYDARQKVEDCINQETNSLIAILQDSQVLNNASEIRAEVKNYVQIVIDQQWPLICSGKIDEAWVLSSKTINPLYKVIQEANPIGVVQTNFYAALPDVLKNLASAQHGRLQQANTHLPIQFWRLINIMTVLILLILVYGNPWKGMSTLIPILIPGMVIALSLSLIISVHYPFLGPFGISSEAFSKVNAKLLHY